MAVKTCARAARILGHMLHDSNVRHPIRAAEHEVAHAREVAAEGTSPATPLILALAVLAVVIPLAATMMLLAFGIADLS
jgi:multisubunit Na+/H+ antiporter MnhC subunit